MPSTREKCGPNAPRSRKYLAKKISRSPSRVYAFRKHVQALLIPAGVVDMAALASRGGGPRFLHAMWTLYEHC